MHPSDEALFQAIQQQNQAAFDTVYLRYAPGVRLHLLRILRDETNAEDVLQEVFLRLRHGFRHAAFSLQSWVGCTTNESLVTWVCFTFETREDPMGRAHPSTLDQRIQWVSQLLAQRGTHGIITQLSREAQVSRPTLYA